MLECAAASRQDRKPHAIGVAAKGMPEPLFYKAWPSGLVLVL